MGSAGEKMAQSEQKEIGINQEALTAMRAAAKAAYPREACGLLMGQSARVAHMIETANVHPSSETHFEIDPQALIDAHRAEREGGSALIGYFHSHPSGGAAPSKTDRAMAAGDGRIWGIVAGEETAFWRDTARGFVPLSYCVTNG